MVVLALEGSHCIFVLTFCAYFCAWREKCGGESPLPPKTGLGCSQVAWTRPPGFEPGGRIQITYFCTSRITELKPPKSTRFTPQNQNQRCRHIAPRPMNNPPLPPQLLKQPLPQPLQLPPLQLPPLPLLHLLFHAQYQGNTWKHILPRVLDCVSLLPP